MYINAYLPGIGSCYISCFVFTTDAVEVVFGISMMKQMQCI
jgi:hypothetical protein